MSPTEYGPATLLTAFQAQIDLLVLHLERTTNVRIAVWPDTVRALLYTDIDALRVLRTELAEQVETNHGTLSVCLTCLSIETRLDAFEIDVVLLHELCRGGSRAREVLLQQRRVERLGQVVLEECEQLATALVSDGSQWDEAFVAQQSSQQREENG